MKFRVWLSEKKYGLKYRLQRFGKGYSDNDLFDLTYWFQNTFVNMLMEFESTLVGSPGDEKGLKEDIDKMDPEWVKNEFPKVMDSMKHFKYFKNSDVDDFTIDDPYIMYRIILRYIAFCLKESSEDNCSVKNEYDDEFYDRTFSFGETPIEEMEKRWETKEYKALEKKWLKRNNEIIKYQYSMKDKAFKLLSKYFYSLWD